MKESDRIKDAFKKLGNDQFKEFYKEMSRIFKKPLKLDSKCFDVPLLHKLITDHPSQVKKYYALLDKKYGENGYKKDAVNVSSGDGGLLCLMKNGKEQEEIEELMSFLLDKDVDKESKDWNLKTPLMIAMQKGKARQVELLLKERVSLAECCALRKTALHWGVEGVKCGVERKEIEKKNSYVRRKEDSPDLKKGKADEERLLTSEVMEMNGIEWECNKALALLLGAIKNHCDKGLINRKDIYGETALHYAVKWGLQGAVKLLMDCGADTTIIDNDCKIPLMKLSDKDKNGANGQCIVKMIERADEERKEKIRREVDLAERKRDLSKKEREEEVQELRIAISLKRKSEKEIGGASKDKEDSLEELEAGYIRDRLFNQESKKPLKKRKRVQP